MLGVFGIDGSGKMLCADGRGRMAGLKRAEPPENVKRGEVGRPFKRGVVAVRELMRGDVAADAVPDDDTGRGASEDALGTGDIVEGPALVEGRIWEGIASTGVGVALGIAMGSERDLAGVSSSCLDGGSSSAGGCAAK